MYTSDFITIRDVNGVEHLVQASHIVEAIFNPTGAHSEQTPLFEFHLSNGNVFLADEEESKSITQNLKKRMTVRKDV